MGGTAYLKDEHMSATRYRMLGYLAVYLDESLPHIRLASCVDVQYAALASKVTMTSEVEHDILVGHNGTWGPNAAAATCACQPSTDAAAAATAAAVAGEATAAARAALSAAQARIEELLDDKADLEYEIDVVERKVELLREEVSRKDILVAMEHGALTSIDDLRHCWPQKTVMQCTHT